MRKVLINMGNFTKILTTVLTVLSIGCTCRAEYRVYQYLVVNTNNILQQNKAYLRTSTLDPVSFISYHGGRLSVKIDLLRTWMCPGYTGGSKTPCPSPYTQLTQQEAERLD